MALLQLRLDVRFPGGGQEGGQPVQVADDLVGDGAGRDLAGPAHQGRHAEGASQLEFFSLRNGVMPRVGPSVHVRPVVGAVQDDRVIGDAELVELVQQRPTALSWSIIVSWYSDCQRPDWPRLSGFGCVRKCMWVVLNHTKKGVSACAGVDEAGAASRNSSSTVSMRFLVSGPVSSMRPSA